MKIQKLNQLLEGSGIRVTGHHTHPKASEAYIDIVVAGAGGAQIWEGAVPYRYRRTGLFLETEAEVADYLKQVRHHFEPENVQEWVVREHSFWEDHGGDVTPLFFRKLLSMEWVLGSEFPRNNNPQRRIQDIKEMGYTLGTKRIGRQYKRKLVPVPRGAAHGYETISPKLRARIIKVLRGQNVYELSAANKKGLLPDHKFPEIRWDEKTREANAEDMSHADIRTKFQLLDNQRNQQKREVCRQCFQTGQRGVIYGIPFFYEGDDEWPEGIPTTGADAEAGCKGCGWYDIARWREAVNNVLDSTD